MRRVSPWFRVLTVLAWTGAVYSYAASAQAETFCVSPSGNDANPGTKDKPFATLERARDEVRSIKARGALTQPVRVLISEGTYRMTKPIVFKSQDSGTATCPIVYEAAPDARPVFTGGKAIEGFQPTADGLWSVLLPEAKQGTWRPEQLWVNGRRAVLARSPNTFYHYIDRPAPYGVDPLTGQTADLRHRAFFARPDDIRPLRGLTSERQKDVVVVVYYAWETARLPLAAADADTGRVITAGPGAWPFNWLGRERFCLENARAFLDEPGEWYLGRDGVLVYKPLSGETPEKATVVAPVASSFVHFEGDAGAGQPVEHITLRGLTFEHAGYTLPPGGHSDPQAAVRVPAVIMADGARQVSILECKVLHTGTYGLWFRRGCRDCRAQRCRFEDLGAGGVRIGQDTLEQKEELRTQHIVCDNNIIHDGGKIFAGAVGVWIGQSSNNQVTHNDISDLFYTGISVGWSWGYADTDCKHNRIEFNHIHHLGKGVLSDMGGVYTLGVSDGTTVSNNVIHDITSYNRYGNAGLGLYNDEGSTHITLENNLVYNTLDMTYHQHYGRENTVRNNILVCGRNYQLSVYRPEPHLSSTFENNIVYFRTGRLFLANAIENRRFRFNRNVYWDASGRPLSFMGMTFAQWQAAGQDKDSAVADPQFEDPEHGDFRLKPGSPALAMGFKPFDYTRAGNYGDPAWVGVAKGFTYRAVDVAPDPPPPLPLVVNEDFESYPVGVAPVGVQLNLENKGDSILTTDQAAAGGKRSLKFTDAPGLKFGFDPHMVLSPDYCEGLARCSYDIRLEPGTEVWNEYRCWTAEPYTIGPSLQMVNGKLRFRDRDLMDVPFGRWFHVEVTMPLGAKSDGSWQVEVTLSGQPPRRFTDLKVVNPGWNRLTWVGFVSNATTKTTFYLDNLRLDNRKD